MSAARVPGGPKVKGKNLYNVLKEIDFGGLYTNKKEFETWHKENVQKIQKELGSGSTGWAAKLINLMLKVEVYIGGRGNQKLVSCIHPPFDNSLKGTLGKNLKENNIDPKKIEQILEKVPEHPFSEIAKYSQYKELMEGLEP